MANPIVTRAIYWNESAGGWYDLATDVHVNNMDPPIFNGDIPWSAAAMSEQVPITRDEVARMILDHFHSDSAQALMRIAAEATINDRIIPEFPAYFMQGRWLVTYDWLADVQQESRNRHTQLEDLFFALHQRINALERPWWKRW